MLYDIEDAIMMLHQIARMVEKDIKDTEISQQLRKLADEINTKIK